MCIGFFWTDCNCFEWYRITNNGMTIIFSINLFTVLKNIKITYCIIRINENTFLIENTFMMYQYQTKLPIYNFDGEILNASLLHPSVHFSTPENSFELINLQKIFNFGIQIDTCTLYMSNIIGNTEISNIVEEYDHYNKLKIFTIYTILHKYGNMINTSKNITAEIRELYYSPNLYLDIIKRYDHHEYARYISNHLNKSISIIELTGEDNISYNIKYDFRTNYCCLPEGSCYNALVSVRPKLYQVAGNKQKFNKYMAKIYKKIYQY